MEKFMPTIFDNIENKLHEGLLRTLETSKRADFCVGYFNLRGWNLLHSVVDKLEGEEIDGKNEYCRVLIGMQKTSEDILIESFHSQEMVDHSEVNKLKKKLARQLREQLTIGIPNEADEYALRRLSRQIKEKKVVVKLYLRNTLHAKLYLAYRDDYNSPIIGFVGSSNLTFSGILKQGELNVDVVEKDASQKLSDWFQDRWEDKYCLDISEELAKILDESWAGENLIPPYYIYLKMAYHLSSEARAGMNEFQVSAKFKEKLLPFQEKAVQVAARHLYQRNGVMIGDVVGLGKTITASALVKMFEDDFGLETLIICPKNLTEMWEDYAHEYQLRAKVISITNVHNTLKEERRYRLVVIDESHNLRNRDGKRYSFVKDYIERNESKVILLTATPYNKSFMDLSSQLRLFIPDDQNIGVSPDKYIESIGGITKFSANHQVNENTITAFDKTNFSEDWQQLMSLYLVRRTRNFIKENYTVIDEINGKKYLKFSDGTRSYFPARIPKKVEYKFDENDKNDQYAKLYSDEIVDLVNSLKLPRYGLGQEEYLNKNPKFEALKEEMTIQDNLGRAGSRLKGFARTNLFKRLESSGFSFLLSISRHLLRNHLFMYAYENKLSFPIGQQEKGLLDNLIFSDTETDTLNDSDKKNEFKLIFDEDKYIAKAKKYYEEVTNQNHKYDWIRAELFSRRLYNHLKHDSESLFKILCEGKDWNQDNDRQLNALIDLCTKTHKKEKVLIFTQYADTAHYITRQFTKKNVQSVECVTGGMDNPTSAAHRFSPISNGKEKVISKENETRVLIATDVLSEGQNLQDSHIVLNYDLPWAIIRLIQRAGRVDRIGQKAEKILCYSFLPEDGIEKIIKLRKRLQNRIQENAEAIGSDEVFFEGDPINLKDLYNEKAGIFDDGEELDIDLGSYAYEIWRKATEENPKLKNIVQNLPDVVYSTKKIEDSHQEGVLVYTRTSHDNDILAYLNKSGDILTKSQIEILKLAKCDLEEKALKRMNEHHELVKKGVESIKKIESMIGGQLGSKNSSRYRTYDRLKNYCNSNPSSLFITTDLEKAIEEIFKYPLRESAKGILNREFKNNITDEDLISLVISLKTDGRLCNVPVEEENKQKEPKIICSMGLMN